MISYLLSGWRVYVPDENGNPLYQGRVYFYDASTSEPSTVYADKEGVTPLGTYVDVDNNGYLPAIWLSASHLYKVVVKRLIQADPETWDTMWEVDDVGNPFLNSEESLGVSTIAVNTISDLKGIGPNDAVRPDYVYVMGWINPGDTGSPMLFRWVSGHNTVVDDGHWISPLEYGFGSWEQIFSGDLDPRKFGAIPDSDNSCDVSFSNCMSYASEPHTVPTGEPYLHFPKTVHFVKEGTYKMNTTFDFTLYTMISEYKSAPVPVVVDDGVYFDKTVTFGKGARINSSSPIAARPIFSNKDSYLKFSWFWIYAGIADSASRVVIIDTYDPDFGSVSLSGKIVINLLDTMPSGVTLTNCVVIDAHDGSLSPDLLNMGAYIISHPAGVTDRMLVDYNGNTIFKFEDGIAKFMNFIFADAGWYVDDDNYLRQPSGANEKQLKLNIKSSVILEALNGNASDISFDRMEVTHHSDIRSLYVQSMRSLNGNRITLFNGIQRSYEEYTWYFSNRGNHDIGSITNFSTYSKFNIIVLWAWSDTSGHVPSDYFYLEGANGKGNGEIICVENCGPKGPGFAPADFNIDGELEDLYEKSGPIYVIGGPESGYTNKIIDVIPPFSRKHFMWDNSYGGWKPVSV